jgi:hypothetical protein
MLGEVEFMGQVTQYGIEFTWKHHSDGHLSISLTQQSCAETLVESLGLITMGGSTFTTPYRSGLAIDSIPHSSMSSTDQDILHLYYQWVVILIILCILQGLITLLWYPYWPSIKVIQNFGYLFYKYGTFYFRSLFTFSTSKPFPINV